ncbi:MAG: hypothetical protein ABI560_00370 [Myxococcales bacterium]
MSSKNEDVKSREPAQVDDPTWWREIFGLGGGEDVVGALPEGDPATLFASDPTSDTGDSAPSEAESFLFAGPEEGGTAPPVAGPISRHRTTYSLQMVNEIASALRALPAKDPSERRLHKQAVIRHIVQEITALQKRGYTLEEVARIVTTEGVEVTTPTLKSYLQRIRNAGGKGARKALPPAALPLVLRRGVR